MAQELSKIGVADGDWYRSAAKENTWITIDFLGTIRNVIAGLASGSQIANTSAKVSSVCLGSLVPLLQIVGGGLVVASAVCHSLPDAYKEYERASSDYKIQDLDGKKVETLNEALISSKLGIANQSLYATMGATLTASGVVNLLSPLGAQMLGFAPVASAAFANGLGAALGAVYLARGAVILARSIYSFSHLKAFEKQFHDTYQQGGAEAVLTFLQRQSESGGLNRRIEDDLASRSANYSRDSEDLVAFLKEVDQQIHKKKLQQKLSLIIGLAMAFGGVAAITMVGLSGGLALPIIALTSAIFFTLMESVYGCYDSSALFEMLRKMCYNEKRLNGIEFSQPQSRTQNSHLAHS